MQLTGYRIHFCAWEAAVLINSATMQTELNKQLARIALPNDNLIEKIDKELSKGKAGGRRLRT